MTAMTSDSSAPQHFLNSINSSKLSLVALAHSLLTLCQPAHGMYNHP